MAENKQSRNSVVKNTTNVVTDGFQAATSYVQNAVENAVETTQDATQNLVNNIMKRRDDQTQEMDGK